MTYYIEVVILNNLVIDALLIVATQMIRQRKAVWWKVLIASIIGAGVAIGYSLAPTYLKVIIRIFLAPLLVLIFDRYKSIKDFIKSLLIFAFMTFSLAGVIWGASNIIGVEIKGYITLGLVALGILLVLIGLKIFLNKRSKLTRKLCDVSVVKGDKNICVKAMCDTGNTLTDDISGLPVVLLSQHMEDEIANTKEIEGFINVKTAIGQSSMPLMKLDKLTVGKKEVEAYGALSRQNFDGYDIILQNTLF